MSAALSTSTCCPLATPAARRARTSRLGSRTPRRVVTSRRGASWWPTIRSPRFTGESVTTRARASATAPRSTAAVSIHSVERFLGDLALEQGWAFDAAAGRHRQARARHRRRAERPVGRLPPGPAGPRGRDPRRRRRAGRDDALRHPRIPDAPRGPGRRGGPDRGDGRAHDPRALGRGSRGREAGGRLRRGLRRGGRPPLQARRHPGPGYRQDRGRGVVPAQRRVRREAGGRAPRGGLRRRQHGDGRRPGGPSAWVRTRR